MKVQDVTFSEAIETYQRAKLDAIREWAKDVELPSPVQVEIGSNRGRFLQNLAALYPEHSVLGIEIRAKFAAIIEEEIQAKGIPNARALCADANLALPLLFADGSLHRVYVLFPDPWWKKRHAKRRLLTPDFLKLVAQKLAPGGHLIIKTDVEPYAQYLEEMLTHTAPAFRLVKKGDEQYPDSEDKWPLTTREGKILQQGYPTWPFYLVRTEAPLHDFENAPETSERFEKPDYGTRYSPSVRPRLKR